MSARAATTPHAPNYWAPMLPLLAPGMLLPRRRREDEPFPFSHPTVAYVHFARNAVYFLARHFGLSGCDVLVPAYFHGVEVEALIAAGVRPRFYPVRAGMRVDPEDVLDAIEPSTRAVYLIHYLGFPAPVQDVQRICRDRGILLIEDCALALLSKTGDRWLGTFGDAAVFCLYKTLPTPDGGAVVLGEGRLEMNGERPNALGTTRETAVSMLRRLSHRRGAPARAAIRAVRRIGKAFTPARQASWVDVGTQRFEVAHVNLLMSRVSRQIVESQDFDAIVEARRRNYSHLQDELSDLAQPVFRDLPRGVCPLFFPFTTPYKRELDARLHAFGIQSVPFWFADRLSPPRGRFPEVDTLRETVLELPCHQDLDASDMARIARAVRRIVRELGST